MATGQNTASFEAVVPEARIGTKSPSLSWVNWVNLIMYVINLVLVYVSVTGAFGATNRELSIKYQTLVTPASFAFSIWGPIFIGEGIFAVTQMLPQFRDKSVVKAIAPFWWSICICQVTWSVVFARDWITAALVLMLAILASLLGLLWRAMSVDCESILEYWLLRAPFSLHAGWIIAASAVQINVQVDQAKASPAELLASAVVSAAVIFALASLSGLALPRPDAIIPLVAAWAFFAVSSELKEATRLLDPTKYNPVAWDRVVLDALEATTSVLSLMCLGLAVVGAGIRIYRSGIGAALRLRTSSMKDEQPTVHQEATLGV